MPARPFVPEDLAQALAGAGLDAYVDSWTAGQRRANGTWIAAAKEIKSPGILRRPHLSPVKSDPT